MRILTALVTVSVALWASGGASAYEFSSTKQMTNVLELYTSEGCSSCPPADQWLSAWVDHPQLWQNIIPLAFHVDYWDYIGWTDRFARPAYSNRQRLYRNTGSVRSVYTPGFILNGKEWRGWYHNRDRIAQPSTMPGELKLEITEPRFSARFIPNSNLSKPARSAMQLHVALLGFGLDSEVRAGENRGRQLQHDFVVLSLQHYANANDKQDGNTPPLVWQGSLPERSPLQDQAERLAWVAWISGPDQRPLQATGGWRRAEQHVSTAD